MKIFIGTPSAPAAWRWYDLSEEEEIEAAKAKCEELDEYLISDVDIGDDLPDGVDCTMRSEWNLEYYLDMNEYLSSIDYEWDKIKAYILIDHDQSYYNDSDKLRSAIDDSMIYKGTMEDVAIEYFENCFDAKQFESVRNYIDFERWGREMEYDGNFVNNWDYILEIF